MKIRSLFLVVMLAVAWVAAGCGDSGTTTPTDSGTGDDGGQEDGGTTDCTSSDECDDDNPCTDDSCQDGVCVFESNTSSCDDGDACTENDACLDGECQGEAIDCDDGVFCNGAETCDAALGCQAGTPPCASGDECNGTCNEEEENCYAPEGTSCADSDYCNGQETCDGMGQCQAGTNPCGDLTCDEENDQCLGCDDDSQCPLCEQCLDGECVDQATGDDLKEECPDAECQTGACDGSGACGVDAAGTACGDPADTECTDPDSCDGAGNCQANHAAADSACGDASDDECTAPDSCDGAGNCQANHAASGTACGDQGVQCLADDSCDGAGACTDNGFSPADTPCPDSEFCNGAETCDGAGTCQPGSDPCPGLICDEDNDQCTGCLDDNDCPICHVCFSDNCVPQPDGSDVNEQCPDGECLTGTCNGQGACGLLAEGSACGDPTDNACNAPDSCDAAGSCQANLAASGSPCGDQGVDCRVDDACDGAGTCVDNGFENPGSACGDPTDNACNGADSCDAGGVCLANLAAPGDPCGDQGVDCRVNDTCDGAGTCVDNGFAPDGSACGDPTDNACNGADTCDASGTCLANLAAPGDPCGDQGVDCHVDDTCDGVGNCADNGFAVDGSACGDPTDNACNGADTCDAIGVCQANLAALGDPCGDQGVDCRVNDTCDGSGNCTDNGFSIPGTACGDPTDNACNGADTCDASGVCQANLAALGDPCGDQGVDCRVNDTCDGSGNCTDNGFATPGSACGDPTDTLCNGADTCDAIGVCQANLAGPGATCDDGDACTDPDTCDGAGQCLSGPDVCNNTVVMVYVAADNDLQTWGDSDMAEMEAANVDDAAWLRVFALFDRLNGSPTARSTRLYEMHNGARTELDGPNLGITAGNTSDELNMGDPATLSGFIQDVKDVVADPTAEYYLIFWNHGDGWYKSKAPERVRKPLAKGVCYDQTSGDDYLSTSEVGGALAGQGITLVGFDACAEGMVEVAYEIRNDASIMVASEDLEPGTGWDYVNLLGTFKAEASPTAVRFGEIAMDTYMDSVAGTWDQATMSVYDLAGMDALRTAADAMAGALMNFNAADFDSLCYDGDLDWLGCDFSGCYWYNDLAQLAHVAKTNYDPANAAVYDAVIAEVGNVVLYHRHGPIFRPTLLGISIYYWCDGNPEAEYNATTIQFAADSQWDEMLNSF